MRSPHAPGALRGTGGMTLVELLVGLTIIGIVLAGGYAALSSIADHRQRVAEVTEAVTRAATIRRTLRDWIWGAHLSAEEAGPEFQGIDATDGAFADDELAFVTNAATGLGGGGVTQVRLFIDRDPRTPQRGLVAEVSEWRGTGRETIEVEPRAQGLDVRYLSGLSSEPQWLPSWISASVLPRGVELTLSAAVPDSLPPLLRLPVVVSLGAPP